MTRVFPLWLLGFALVSATLVSLPFATVAHSGRSLYFLEVTATSTESGIAQLFYDLGQGVRESDSSNTPLGATKVPKLIRLPLPLGEIRALRFDPLNRESQMTLASVRIADSNGATIREFHSAEITPLNQISDRVGPDDRVILTMPPGANDPSVMLTLATPLRLENSPRYWLRPTAQAFGIAFLSVIALGMIPFGRWWNGRGKKLRMWAQLNPTWALLAMATVSVAIQCHPVIFFGRSLLSPDNGTYLFYDEFPTLPGYRSTTIEDTKEADVGAMMWQHSSYPRLQREAIFKWGELPLWNRYDLCGVPLLGQGQSMFGDPLNALTMLCNGAAWAWDARFVVMRLLFAFGVGLVVWLLVADLGAALLITCSMPFLGFFAFRLNHPAILSVGWSPWILVAWCWLWRARDRRSVKIALGALAGFHLCMLSSGTVKEAAMAVACLDLAGFLLIAMAAVSWREKLAKLGGAAAAGIIFALISAPIWLTFLTTLAKSRTNYDQPSAVQFPPWQILGFFDDLFYRQFRANEAQVGPSTNFLLLLGCLWGLVNLRAVAANPRFRAIALAALVPLAFVFKGVPEALIVKLPFIANIIHVANTFSCPLIVLAAVFAGFGLSFAGQQFNQPSAGKRYAGFLALLAVCAIAYFSQSRATPKSPFFIGYIAALLGVIVLIPPIWRRAQRTGNATLYAVTLIVGLGLLLWRHGEYLATPFDAYVFNPQTRVDLSARAASIDFIDHHLAEPERTVGLGYILFPGYHQVLGWESIYGVDAVRNRYLDDLAVLTPLRKIYDWGTGPIEQIDVGAALPMQDLMNVRYYLARHQTEPRPLPGRTLLAQDDLDLYESPTVWPRAFFTSSVGRYATTGAFISAVLQGDRRPAAFVQNDERDLPNGVASLSATQSGRDLAAAKDFVTTSNTTRFTVVAPRAGVVVLTESFYPGDFRVTINGVESPYFRVNHAFKGIYVPASGTYTVEFDYWPEHLTLSLWLCATGAALALSAGLVGRRSLPAGAQEIREG